MWRRASAGGRHGETVAAAGPNSRADQAADGSAGQRAADFVAAAAVIGAAGQGEGQRPGPE